MSYTVFIINIRSDSSDVVGLMKQHLPEYNIVNCFIVAGFDSVDAICAMDDNTVSVIEEFIDKRKECYPSCIRQAPAKHPFLLSSHLVTKLGLLNLLL